MDTDNYFQRLDRLNAIHEAGHAVMTLLTSTPLGCVSLGPPDVSGNFGGNRRAICEDPACEVVIRFAGVGAELIERNENCWSFLFRSSGRSDWKGAQSYIGLQGGDVRACISNAKTEVLKLLRGHWQWVESVADELQRSRFVMGAQVEVLRPLHKKDDN
jgi:hypothetical protein